VSSLVDIKLLNKVSVELKKQRLTIATAESCTGGLLAHLLTNISGSSEYFDRGMIVYSNRAKTELLGVPEDLLDRYGAVSEQIAKGMANAIRTRSIVDIGISTTGIAGPTGGTRGKPVGLVYIGISTKKNSIVKKFLFTGGRLVNKENTCNAALELLFEILLEKKR
jgi:nicotinamide-nucleotide amidase